MTKKIELEKLNKKIKNCKKCPLWKLRKNAVPGEGPVKAKIIIIGQAPGVEEDRVGKPFVGRAGKFLNKLLEIAEIKREKIFITSPLKCFPPKNRKPKKEEIEACLPYLKKQIEIINPPARGEARPAGRQKFILLGEVAFSVFFPDKKLKDFRGKWITLRSPQGEKKFFITYHPAAGLRFPKIKKILEKDFRKLKNIFIS
jgi:DNA polymerase